MKKKLFLALSLFMFGFSISDALATAGPGVGCRVLVAPESCNKEQTKCTLYVVKYAAALQMIDFGKPLKEVQKGDTVTIMGVIHTVESKKDLGGGDYSIQFVHTGTNPDVGTNPNAPSAPSQ